MSQPTKVIVAGAGIAGPALSVLLKSRDYEPILCERTENFTDGGLALCLQPNGLLVLAKVPGLLKNLEGRTLEKFDFYSILPEDRGALAESDIPKLLKEHYGVGMQGVRRATFHRELVDTATRAGVQIKWGHKLVDIQQGDDSVKVKFENGNEETASFVVGCDGLHSNTRTCLFGAETADFTGLVQTGGLCPIPDTWKGDPPTMRNIFGNGAHMVVYPVNDSFCSWAATQREPEAKESWRDLDRNSLDEFRKTTNFENWGYGAGDAIRSTERIVKYGLYDRPALETWHKRRVCLIGDAAHPTSPHLGQGANQAFEDVDLLVTLLDKHNPSAAPPSTATLETVFTEFEKIRIPRSAALVKHARTQGESRVVGGVEGCLKRNAIYREIWKDEESVIKHLGYMYEQ